MNIEDMQKRIDEWFREIGAEYWDVKSMGLRMAEEVGELAREINNKYGDKPRKIGEKEETKKIDLELGDILFTACCIANKLEINLGETFKLTMDKYEKRDKYRHSK